MIKDLLEYNEVICTGNLERQKSALEGGQAQSIMNVNSLLPNNGPALNKMDSDMLSNGGVSAIMGSFVMGNNFVNRKQGGINDNASMLGG